MTIKRQCELLGLARSSAYYKAKFIEPSEEEVAIKNAMDLIHYREPSYGVRRIKHELNKQGFTKIGSRRVRRYMREMNIKALYPGPNLSKRARDAKVYPYLLRNLEITRPNQVWSIDITYIGTPSGYAYMTAIIDWYSRFIVGYSISTTLQVDTVLRVVEQAASDFGKPEIINSDQGSQFTAKEYIELVRGFKGTKISMDGKGRATDNVAIERLFRSYKWERLYLMYPETVREVKQITKEYMEHYNYSRAHQSYDYKTPAEIYFSSPSENLEKAA